MKAVEIIGYQRANLGKTESKRLRSEGYIPCVLYGGKEQIHFYAPNILFRDLVYTDRAHFVDLNIEGQKVRGILQDIQFHPVNEAILHADFLQLFENKKIKMSIPVQITGSAPGVLQGGKIIVKLRHIMVRALPKEMPENIEVDVSQLQLGKTIKVGELPSGNYEILNSPLVSIVGVEVPRALKGKAEGEGEEAAVAAGGEEEASAE